MRFSGADAVVQGRAHARWQQWCARQGDSQVVAFAAQLADGVESLVRQHPQTDLGMIFNVELVRAREGHTHINPAQALEAVFALSSSWFYGPELEGWYLLHAAMQFKGSDDRTRTESWRLWQQWLSQNRQRPSYQRMAARLVAALESRLTPQTRRYLERHADDAFGDALVAYEQESQAPPLSPQDIARLINILSECWVYGAALRVWGVKAGFFS